MHVIIRHQISGARGSQPWPARGESIDLPDDEAHSLIVMGHAIEVADTAAGIETASVPTEPTGSNSVTAA